MPQIIFETEDGQALIVNTEAEHLMQAALDHEIPGIEGACGGVCSCATCHVHIDPAWTELVGPPNDFEAALLELEDQFKLCSRLGCQVKLTPELDGLKVRVATGAS